MKLGDLIDRFDYLENGVIYELNNDGTLPDDDDSSYEGSLMDTPYYLTKMKLAESKDFNQTANYDSYTSCSMCIKTNKNGVTSPYLVVYVVDKEE